MVTPLEQYPRGSDNEDSFLYMVSRRLVNEDYAENPVDFNVQGLLAAQAMLEPERLSAANLIADIGCSSGLFIVSAAEKTGTEAFIVGIEPDPEATLYLPDLYKGRIAIMQGYGEDIPLPTNSVVGATGHNVIFRSSNIPAMLSEMKRIVEPGGMIAISTKAKGHAEKRYRFQRQVAREVSELTGLKLHIPEESSDGSYIEDLAGIIEETPGLEVRDDLRVDQDTKAIITRERLDDYLFTVSNAVSRTDLPPTMRYLWRQVVGTSVKTEIEQEINAMEESDRREGVVREPFFADIIRRSMVVMLNVK